MKALHLHLGQEAWGHVVAKLLRELPKRAEPSPDLVEKARVLDGAYIPARYPNSYAEGPPSEHFGSLQSEQALSYAREILDFARAQMA